MRTSLNGKKPGLRLPSFEFGQKLYRLGYKKIIGVDEVGRGALAGPVVVAAVEISQPIAGINDSKVLTALQRSQLSREILEKCGQVAFGSATNDEIDQLGLGAALRLAYARALEKVVSDLILTDYYNLPGEKHIRAIHGDQLFYPVAAASIVAKVYRDEIMKNYAINHSHYGWATNVGYGTAFHYSRIKQHGLTPLHRRSFLSTLKIMP